MPQCGINVKDIFESGYLQIRYHHINTNETVSTIIREVSRNDSFECYIQNLRRGITDQSMDESWEIDIQGKILYTQVSEKNLLIKGLFLE